MKKVLIACFFAIIMMLVPFTTVAKTETVSNNKQMNSLFYEIPEFYITSEQRLLLESYIELKYEGEDKEEAYTIFNTIISEDNQIDIVEFANAVFEHGVQQIPPNMLSETETIQDIEALINIYWKLQSVFQGLIDQIMELVKERLGWLYKFLIDGIELVIDGAELIVDIFNNFFIAALTFVTAINNMIFVPGFFRDLLTELFAQNFTQVGNMINTLTTDVYDTFIFAINGLKSIIQDPVLLNYLDRLIVFLDWLKNEPWKDPILVYGSVKLNLLSLQDATITCRGQTTTTNSEGGFSFEIDPAPDGTSFPPGEYYGMHECVISVSRDGKVLKQTIPALSYVFSGGNISWRFFIFKSRSNELSFREQLLERMSIFWEKIYTLFPNLDKIYSRFDISIA